MKMIKTMMVAAVLVASVFAGNAVAGKITYISVSGADDPAHPNVVQLIIEGGYAEAGCDNTIAAIRDSETYLISMALIAQKTGDHLIAVLNSNDKYFDNRCIISRLSIDRR